MQLYNYYIFCCQVWSVYFNYMDWWTEERLVWIIVFCIGVNTLWIFFSVLIDFLLGMQWFVHEWPSFSCIIICIAWQHGLGNHQWNEAFPHLRARDVPLIKWLRLSTSVYNCTYRTGYIYISCYNILDCINVA